MNSTHTNEGGWKDCEMRTYLNKTVHNSLPSDLQAVIKTVNKISDNGNKDTTTLNTTQDKLFLLSFEEVGFTSNNVFGYNVNGQGTKYNYFSNNASRVKYCLNGEPSFWWLRSAGTNNTDNFFSVHSSGIWYYGYAGNIYGVAPAFCI